ncbi:hypothetical protein IQ249_00875 [Lusitaniella coriacea LEGE 07157]|uniref:Uncharacterized protein n=1 Tax=Lusitaniella coriacea LEGE 07157 TaxID=945747 RepID=A0A8J7AM97_9CYAN|nr:hypothetical protein [Lusitaniella coriacea]MBE9114438.1 hypothetical protein [Lusitaniella coriacea LEGE 07157]
MKVIQVSEDSTTLATLLEAAQHENLILRTADGLEFILAELDDFDREIELTRQNEELMDFLNRRAEATQTVSAAEARARLLD